MHQGYRVLELFCTMTPGLLNLTFLLALFSVKTEAWISISGIRDSPRRLIGSRQLISRHSLCGKRSVYRTGLEMTPEVLSEKVRFTSLADQYLVEISSNTKWSLFSIEQVVKGKDLFSEGAKSSEALSSSIPSTLSPAAALECVNSDDGNLDVTLSSEKEVDKDLLGILARILVQWRSDQLQSTSARKISLFDGDVLILTDLSNEQDLGKLFAKYVDTSTSIEWVEMVTGAGQILGRAPRRLVHTCNLLHRGIGLFVSEDKGMTFATDFPALYVHRRTDTKRIFPSLYDMFVGGVSLAGEDAAFTARREVAEELGLSRALEGDGALSDPIFDCVVCTAYNRCLVTLFTYTMDSQRETVTWQEEEVAWGDFVPYPIVAAAADLSIQRLVEDGKWPGTLPAVQSDLKGCPPGDTVYKTDGWGKWDFVPDGLLVWEAWLNMLRNQ